MSLLKPNQKRLPALPPPKDALLIQPSDIQMALLLPFFWVSALGTPSKRPAIMLSQKITPDTPDALRPLDFFFLCIYLYEIPHVYLFITPAEI